jgi:hypothetical protein
LGGEHDEGEGTGGGMPAILQSEWEAKKRSIATLLKILQVEFILSPVRFSTINIFH